MLAMEKLSLPVESGKSTPLFFLSRPNYRRYLILFPDENKQETVPLCMSGSLRTNRNRFYTPPRERIRIRAMHCVGAGVGNRTPRRTTHRICKLHVCPKRYHNVHKTLDPKYAAFHDFGIICACMRDSDLLHTCVRTVSFDCGLARCMYEEGG